MSASWGMFVVGRVQVGVAVLFGASWVCDRLGWKDQMCKQPLRLRN